MSQSSKHGLFAVGVLLAAFAFAWPRLMTTLAPYDDEGYVMMTVKTFNDGHRLYGDTHTQYGPAFYLLDGPIHRWILPLTQNWVRAKTFCFWAVSSILVGWIAWRISRDIATASITSLLAIVHLEKLALEPGHPQEWILLLWLLAVASMSLRTRWRWGIAALFVALSGMIKINCGLVAAVPLLLTCVGWKGIEGQASDRQLWLSRLTQAMVVFSLVVPIGMIAILGRRHVVENGAALLCMLISAIALSSVRVLPLVTQRTKSNDLRMIPTLRAKSFWMVALSGLAASSAIIAWTLWQGTSLSELRWGLVGQHAAFVDTFFHPVRVTFEGVLFSIVSFTLLGISIWHPKLHDYRHRIALGLGSVALGGVLLSLIACVFRPLVHGLEERGASFWLVGTGPALAPWLVVHSKRMGGMRWMLSGLAVLGPCIAFPTPGTQLSLGTIPGLLVVCLVVSENAKSIRRPVFLCASRSSEGAASLQWLQHASSGICGLVVFVGSAVAWGRWSQWESLGLPGSEWLHLEPHTSDEQRRIVQAIQAVEGEYLAFDGHNHNRFYFWTKRLPLSAANPTFWPNMLSFQEQTEWREQLEFNSKICVVVPPKVDKLVTPRSQALRDSLLRGWHSEVEVNAWSIGTRSHARVEQASSR